MELDELIDDLAAEQAALDAILSRLPAAAWDRPTHAPGWAVRDQVSHLAFVDEAATLAIRDPEAFGAQVQAASADADGYTRGYLERGRALTPAELRARWQAARGALLAAARGLDPRARLPWYGPAMSAASFLTARLMETWAHGLDIVDVVDLARPDTDRLRHVAFIGWRARPYAYAVRGREMPPAPIRVELVAPSGERWVLGEAGAANRVTGTAVDFCRVVTQRRHLADTDLVIEGDAAREWMAIAQAFAGPPGPGRQPGEFPKEQTRA